MPRQPEKFSQERPSEDERQKRQHRDEDETAGFDPLACLNAQRSKLYHIGIRGAVSRSTLANAAKRRDYRLFEALGQRLIAAALVLYGDEDIGLGLKGPVFAMDSTSVDVCLALFPWAYFRQTKAAVKAHVVMDLRGAIPVFISITTGKVHDVRPLDEINLPAGSILHVKPTTPTTTPRPVAAPFELPCLGSRAGNRTSAGCA